MLMMSSGVKDEWLCNTSKLLTGQLWYEPLRGTKREGGISMLSQPGDLALVAMSSAEQAIIVTRGLVHHLGWLHEAMGPSIDLLYVLM